MWEAIVEYLIMQEDEEEEVSVMDVIDVEVYDELETAV